MKLQALLLPLRNEWLPNHCRNIRGNTKHHPPTAHSRRNPVAGTCNKLLTQTAALRDQQLNVMRQIHALTEAGHQMLSGPHAHRMHERYGRALTRKPPSLLHSHIKGVVDFIDFCSSIQSDYWSIVLEVPSLERAISINSGNR
jgi:hypothetical protein